MLLSKKDKGRLGYQVYIKKTHADKYLHADSHHHPAEKVGIIKTLAVITTTISDAEHLKMELNHLGMVFRKNGYHKEQISKATNKTHNSQ